jgi:hypothetical protein
MRIVHLAKLLFFLCLLSPLGAFAQPNGINYQLVARNNSGEIVISKTIKVKASILKGSLKGAPVLMELHTVRTNEVGLFILLLVKVLELKEISKRFSGARITIF